MKKHTEPATAKFPGVPANPRNTGVPPLPEHYEISQLAFQLYESRGWQDGYDIDDWLRAEHELIGR
jgi:hypothetical protein